MEKSFESKILLFGEYSIIHDSMALSIPYHAFGGKLTSFPKHLFGKNAKKSNNHLIKFANHILEMKQEGKLPFEINAEQFVIDAEKGLIFDSNIPQGAGVGSSGALVATVYDTYTDYGRPDLENISSQELKELKARFAALECYFHGDSSGLDPLSCYVKKPILVKDKNNFSVVGLPKKSKESNSGIFVINSGLVGKTEPLVRLFKEKCVDEKYLKKIKEELIPFNNECIGHFLDGDVKSLLKDIKKISHFALQNLSPMIPSKIQKIWKSGLESGNYSLKLCGSGGGGYILGFTDNLELAKKDLKDYPIQVVHTL
jgi:mevalonate kinase